MNSILVRQFIYNNRAYHHCIFTTEDDRVELHDSEHNVLMTYTADTVVFDKDKNILGRIWIGVDNYLVYRSEDDSITIIGDDADKCECYLDIEVLVSKHYLNLAQHDYPRIFLQDVPGPIKK